MATDPAYTRALNDGQHHARKALRDGGYASGGEIADEKQDKRDIARGVHKHEAHLHKGQPETPLARGGRPGTKVVVNAGADKALDMGRQAGLKQGIQVGARMAAQRGAAAAGPMAGAPAGGMRPPMQPRPMPQPGGAPIAPTAAGMGAKKGGKVGKK